MEEGAGRLWISVLSYREKGTHDSFSDVLGVVFRTICISHAGQV